MSKLEDMTLILSSRFEVSNSNKKSNVMHNDFKLVKRKRQRKQKTDICESQVNFTRKFQKTLEEFESSRFCFELLQTIETCLRSIDFNSVGEILSYGIGNFLESKSSLHQLAALVSIQKKYNAAVALYDPVFTSSEIKALNDFNFQVIPDNEEGKRTVTGDKVTLVFLPHCPKQLVNNFLWANWSCSLYKSILITNSFSKIIQDNTEKALQKSADYIVKIYQKTKEIPLEDCYSIENIFNDISLHYFRLQDLDSNFFSETLDKEPSYLEESELITKTLNNLNIKNE